MIAPQTALTLWLIYGCGAFGIAGSVGPCVFEDYKDCLTRTEQIQKEQDLPIPPSCYSQEIEVWWQ